MCGIVGSVNNKSEYLDKTILAIKHRGPDSEGTSIIDNVFLGHTRLSIIDLSEHGAQPMVSRDNRYTIIFNGEIYNHIELRRELPEINFDSTSDTETVLYSYVKFGKACLNKFIGIFSFAIYDKAEKKLFIARDQFGVKPLYYFESDTEFLFSSEIKALNDLNFDRSLNYQGLKNYLTFMWSPGEMTPYKNIKKLNPGHFISISTEDKLKLTIEKYYQIPFNGNYLEKNEKQWVDTLEEELYEAVKRQMMADVPLGFFLSGGLDSSLLVALAKKHFPNQELQCYTIDTGEHYNRGFVQDIDYAKKVAEVLKVNLKITKATIDVIRDFDKMIYHLDEPQADPAPLNVINICQLARDQGIKVMLSGTGGDDIFSGYRRHQSLKLEPLYAMMPLAIRKAVSYMAGQLPTSNYKLYRLRKLLIEAAKPQQQRMNNYFNVLPIEFVNELFHEDIREEVKLFDPNQYFSTLLQQIPNEKNLLNKMLYMEIHSFLVDHNFNYTDKMGMAVGVEIRVPYADKKLVELSASIPPELKMNGTTTKYILRKVAERYLPKDVIYRPKTGFGAPIDYWVKNDLKIMIDERLNEEFISQQRIFDASAISNLISKNSEGKMRGAYPIWSLLAIQSWLKQFGYNR